MVSKSSQRLCTDDRAQTLQDYALGVSLFLGVVFIIVGFTLPSVIAPFDSGAGGESVNQADRVSGSIVQNASLNQQPNELNATTVETVVGLDLGTLKRRYNVPSTSSLNITVRTLDGNDIVHADGTPLRTGRPTTGRPVATSTRIVTLSDGSCSPACRLVVGVW